MTLDRQYNWNLPFTLKTVEDCLQYIKDHYAEHQEESAMRIADFNTFRGTIAPFIIGDGASNYSEFEQDGTLEFNGTATVFDDVFIPFDSAKVPAVNNPTWASFVGNLNAYTFNTDDYLEVTGEIPHGYKAGSDLEFHIHWATNGLEGTARAVKWEIEYSIADVDILDGIGDAFPVPTVESLDIVIPLNTPDISHMYSAITTDTAGTYAFGALVKARVRRKANTHANNEPAADPFGLQLGIHYEMDTVGSRTISTK